MLKTFRKNPAVAGVVGLCVTAATASADPISIRTSHSVDQSVARLTQAVQDAGYRVFTTVDFSKGSAQVGNSLRPTTLVMFGSPKIGADALLSSQTIGLSLPLRVLAYEDAAGATWLMFPDPRDAAVQHGIAAEHPAVTEMRAALDRLTTAATDG
ncbi:MAG: DUF302 domain-containing protein [Rhodobacteraceae bacterium]|nr:DUF302 domain-containing protein [Paracoccaceae bacterium]